MLGVQNCGQRACYTCSCGLRAAKRSPDTEDNAKQKTRNLHCTRNCQV